MEEKRINYKIVRNMKSWILEIGSNEESKEELRRWCGSKPCKGIYE